MSKRQTKLNAVLNKELEKYRNPYHMAIEKGDCYGLVYRCLNGGFSPTLYKKYIRATPRKRRRFIVEDPEGAISKTVDALRGDMTRAEFLEALLGCWQGEAELRY